MKLEDIVYGKYEIVGGVVNVDGSVDLSNKNLKRIPFKFGIVTGNFYCNDNLLITLKGSPKEVGGLFACHYNQLTTLEGSPKIVKGSFDCSHNQLTTLERGPKKVGLYIDCRDNPIMKKILG